MSPYYLVLLKLIEPVKAEEVREGSPYYLVLLKLGKMCEQYGLRVRSPYYLVLLKRGFATTDFTEGLSHHTT